MFVKVTNDTPVKYTLGELRRDNSNVSFPKVIPEETLAEYNVYEVVPTTPPKFDNKTHRLTETVESVDGVWTQVWAEVALPEDRAALNVRRYRDQLLAETDYLALSDNTLSAEMATYRQALRDITTHANFPNLEDADWPTKP
jgi:hypothetical protein